MTRTTTRFCTRKLPAVAGALAATLIAFAVTAPERPAQARMKPPIIYGGTPGDGGTPFEEPEGLPDTPRVRGNGDGTVADLAAPAGAPSEDNATKAVGPERSEDGSGLQALLTWIALQIRLGL